MKKIVQKLKKLLDGIEVPDKRLAENKFSIKEIVGHLIDSASNNHQRFNRFDASQVTILPNYKPYECVRRANYAGMHYAFLVNLWYSYNLLVLNIVSSIPNDCLGSQFKIGDTEETTLQCLIDDYYTHMSVHHSQILDIINC